MKEELIVSGKLNPFVDPHLAIWHWQIPLYLFLGGLAAGILFFAALFTIQGKQDKYPTAVKIAPLITPIILIIGLLALLWDLKHKLFFWQLYTSIHLEPPDYLQVLPQLF
jgi:protein NrfD